MPNACQLQAERSLLETLGINACRLAYEKTEHTRTGKAYHHKPRRQSLKHVANYRNKDTI
jgi:hypothetical protein